MKVYVSADWEGICGLVGREHDKAQANRWMTEDVNAAVAGAFDGGATEVVVKDAHASALNIDPELLDARATLISGWRAEMCMVDELDETYDALMLIGAHARNHAEGGVLHHTFTLRFDEVRVNGRVFGETALSASIAGHFGVPTIMVSGDEATCAELSELLGEVETAPVKRGLTRQSGVLVPLKRARGMIRDAAYRAVSDLGRFQPLVLDKPIELAIDLSTVACADLAALVPGIEKTGPRSVRAVAADAIEMWKFFRVMVVMTMAA